MVNRLAARSDGRPKSHPAAELKWEEGRPQSPLPSVSPRLFMGMAWLANPFAGLGIHTVGAIIPGLARELRLDTTSAGIFCSIWFFARMAAFLALWQWKGWHYRFRWLFGAFLALMAGFATILTCHQIGLLVVAQVAFGLSVGFMYFSSLFYSMDVGETKAEHGGFHEAAMGAGNCLGPAIGAAALLLAPQIPGVAGFAVTGVMSIGLVGLLSMRLRPVVADEKVQEKSAGLQ